ncbi:MAG: hypothetical protein EKK40_18895 [Bradyrhizobiaceae bacterium]|nr:MAG: hypothetical protein EKK40_18895 [Bradyrhizobiaceae bacterium]
MDKKRILDRRPKSARKSPEAEISFFILDGKRQQSCVLRTTYPSQAHAMTYIKKNRNKIEAVARRKLSLGMIEGSVIYVDQC